jgi:hypothetical protein
MGCRRDLKAEDVRVVLKGKQVEGLVRCEDALAIVSRLLGYCQAKWPGAKLHPEYPVMVKNERSQRAMGWIDLLIETDEGFVIIDHKSYVGDDLDEKALGYSGQLAFYREAVELATGRPVLGCCVHFMFGGRLISLTKNTFTASDVA